MLSVLFSACSFLSLFVPLWNSLKRAAKNFCLPASFKAQIYVHIDRHKQSQVAWKVINNWVKWHMRAGD